MFLQNSRFMIYRVTNANTLAAIADAMGVKTLLEACRIPGKTGSVYRAWTEDGQCYELPRSGERAMQPHRRPQFDRKVAA